MPQALLMIDLQNDYFPGGDMPLSGIDEASARAAELLESFRKGGLPLIHVRHEFPDASAPFFRPDSTGAAIHESVGPAASEAVVTKNHIDAFQQTDLKERLDAQGVDELVICGAMSHMCIEGTTRAAADLGYRCHVVHDACATRDQEFDDHVISAADVHGTAMSTLSMAYAKVVSLSDWRRSSS